MFWSNLFKFSQSPLAIKVRKCVRSDSELHVNNMTWMKQNHCCFFASINYVKSRAIARKKIMAEAMSMKKLWMTEAISIVLNFLPIAFKMTKNSQSNLHLAMWKNDNSENMHVPTSTLYTSHCTNITNTEWKNWKKVKYIMERRKRIGC